MSLTNSNPPRVIRVRERRRRPAHAEAQNGVPTTGDERLTVGARERTLIGPELLALVAGLRDEDARREYIAVLDAFEAGDVKGEPLEKLSAFLEMALTTGRIRHRLGAQGEDAVRRVYERTPRGAAQAASAAEVTQALEKLTGGTLRDLRISLVRPGTYRLVFETDQYRLSIGLAPAGAHVESVELAL